MDQVETVSAGFRNTAVADSLALCSRNQKHLYQVLDSLKTQVYQINPFLKKLFALVDLEKNWYVDSRFYVEICKQGRALFIVYSKCSKNILYFVAIHTVKLLIVECLCHVVNFTIENSPCNCYYTQLYIQYINITVIVEKFGVKH